MNTASEQTPIQILIIEDDAILAMYVSDLLEAQGYEVVGTVDNGREALTAVPAKPCGPYPLRYQSEGRH